MNKQVNPMCSFILPQKYSNIESNEMVYIDGGAFYRPIFNGAGAYILFYPDECRTLANNISNVAALEGIVSGILAMTGVALPVGGAFAIAASVNQLTSNYINQCADAGGFHIQLRTNRVVDWGMGA